METPLLVETGQGKEDQGWVPGFGFRQNPFSTSPEQIDPLEEQIFNIKK